MSQAVGAFAICDVWGVAVRICAGGRRARLRCIIIEILGVEASVTRIALAEPDLGVFTRAGTADIFGASLAETVFYVGGGGAVWTLCFGAGANVFEVIGVSGVVRVFICLVGKFLRLSNSSCQYRSFILLRTEPGLGYYFTTCETYLS